MKTAEDWSQQVFMKARSRHEIHSVIRAIQVDALEAAAGQIDGWSPANRAIQKAIRDLITKGDT